MSDQACSQCLPVYLSATHQISFQRAHFVEKGRALTTSNNFVKHFRFPHRKKIPVMSAKVAQEFQCNKSIHKKERRRK